MKAISKNRLKYLHKLKLKKFRDAENLFIISGLRAVKTALENPHIHVEEAILTQEMVDKADQVYKQLKTKVKISWLNDKEYTKLADEKTPQGICLVVQKPATRYSRQRISGDLLLFLEQVNDPGNLGTIIRSAEWFGIKTILLSANSVDPFHPKAVRASAGTVLHISILENISEEQLKPLKEEGYKVLATDILSGRDISGYKFPEKSIIMMGSEAHGLGPQYKALCDDKLSIIRLGSAESLNLANAAAIIMYQAVNNQQ